MNPVPRTAVLLAMATLLGACSSTPPQTAARPAPAVAPVASPAATPRPSSPANAGPAATSTVRTVVLPAHLDPGNVLSKERSIFFDFDDDSIKPSYRSMLETHGRYLAAQARLNIKLEGHADERGSKEYNLALGQRRAESVLKSLQLLGARTSQMEPVSWGEEKPRVLGHDEAAWAQSRRVDIQYPTK